MFKDLFKFRDKESKNISSITFSDSRYLNVIDIAINAGKILLKFYERGDMSMSVANKNNDILDFVTKADKESDNYICSEMSKLFINDNIVSEESFIDDYSFGGRTWFVDPLDGTKEFIFEGGRFSVMIGLCVEGNPVFGVVYNPLEEVVYVAEKGFGSFSKKLGNNWKILKVNKNNSIEKSTQIIRKLHDEKRDSDFFIDSLKTKNSIQDASFGLRLGRIASGEADFTIATNRRVSKWDICAPQIILEEAGGIVTDILGKKIDYLSADLRLINSFTASNSKFHKEIVSECKRLAVLWGIATFNK